MLACARCHRPIRTAVIVGGLGYGKTCAEKVGDLLVQPAQTGRARKRRSRRPDGRQLALEVAS